MFQHNQSDPSHFNRLLYVVADPEDVQGVENRYDFADNPCQDGREEECAEWLRGRLTDYYND